MPPNWIKNITGTPDGKFRTINGTADELIAIGRAIKAGYATSKVDITNARYDAIIDLGNNQLLRIQIKGVGAHGTADFTGGTRSGKQVSRSEPQRTYKYSKNDCDIMMLIDSNNGDCYLIPIDDIQSWGNTKKLSTLQEYRENWEILTKNERT